MVHGTCKHTKYCMPNRIPRIAQIVTCGPGTSGIMMKILLICMLALPRLQAYETWMELLQVSAPEPSSGYTTHLVFKLYNEVYYPNDIYGNNWVGVKFSGTATRRAQGQSTGDYFSVVQKDSEVAGGVHLIKVSQVGTQGIGYLNVTIYSDSAIEPDETVTVTIDTRNRWTIRPGAGSATFTIKDPRYVAPPTVTTATPTTITSSSAMSGGNITSQGGASVTSRGVCWSTATNPTIGDSKTNDGAGIGTFTSTMSGLQAGTTYYVRAYATSSAGTSYGANMSFVTTANTRPTVEISPAAYPATVVGTSAELSMLASDDGGEPSLTYTWSLAGTPPASVIYSENASNSAKKTRVTFSKSGTYDFRATIADAQGLTATASVVVQVTATINKIAVSPENVLVEPGAKRTLYASALDQFGAPILGVPFQWSTSGGATIDPASGILTAGTVAGTYRVIASAAGRQGSAGFTITPATAIRINFAPDSSPIPAGYDLDSGSVFGIRSNGLSYGWNSDHTTLARDRGINTDQRLDTLIHFKSSATWSIAVPNGNYFVLVSVGDPQYASAHTIRVQGTTFWSGLSLSANQYAKLGKTISVANGTLAVDQGSAIDRATRINYIEIYRQSSGAIIQAPRAAAPNSLLSLPAIISQGTGTRTVSLSGGATFPGGSTSKSISVPYSENLDIQTGGGAGTISILLDGMPLATIDKISVSFAAISRRPDLPPSITLRKEKFISTTFSKALGNGHSMTFQSELGYVNVTTGGQAAGSGQIGITGMKKSEAPEYKEKILAYLDGDPNQLCGESVAFNVCPHPTDVSLNGILSNKFTSLQVSTVVTHNLKSDSGQLGDLVDSCKFAEVVDQQISGGIARQSYQDNPPFTYTGAFRVSWFIDCDWQMMRVNGSFIDTHSMTGSYITNGPEGRLDQWQGHMFKCACCGADKNYIDYSGYCIERKVLPPTTSGGNYRYRLTKYPFGSFIPAQSRYAPANVQEDIPGMSFIQGFGTSQSTPEHLLPAP